MPSGGSRKPKKAGIIKKKKKEELTRSSEASSRGIRERTKWRKHRREMELKRLEEKRIQEEAEQLRRKTEEQKKVFKKAYEEFERSLQDSESLQKEVETVLSDYRKAKNHFKIKVQFESNDFIATQQIENTRPPMTAPAIFTFPVTDSLGHLWAWLRTCECGNDSFIYSFLLSAMTIPIRRLPYPVLREIFNQMDPESLVNFIRTNKSSIKLLPAMSVSVSVNYYNKDPFILVTTASAGIQSELPFGYYRKVMKVFKWIELDCLKIVVSNKFKRKSCLRLLSLLKYCKFTSCNYLMIQSVEEGVVLKKEAIMDITKQLKTINEMFIDVSMEELPENLDPALAVTVTNGDLLADTEIMLLEAEEILVESSRIGDTGACLIIKNWIAHGESLRYLELKLADEWKLFEDDNLGMDHLLCNLDFQVRGEGRFETKHLGSVLSFEDGFDIQRDDGKKATIVRTPDTLYFMQFSAAADRIRSSEIQLFKMEGELEKTKQIRDDYIRDLNQSWYTRLWRFLY